MTVLQNAYIDNPNESQLKGNSIDKNKLVTNWIGEEMHKFDGVTVVLMKYTESKVSIYDPNCDINPCVC